MIELTTIDTPLGAMRVAARDGAVVAAVFPGGWRSAEDALRRRFDEPLVDAGGRALARTFERYFGGDVRALDALDVDLGGTPFQARVWRALRRVPVGETVSYGWVARAAGNARAVRAAGTATGANPAAVIVPCHRILRSDGGIGGYGGGLARKRWLLAHEQRFTPPATRARR